MKSLIIQTVCVLFGIAWHVLEPHSAKPEVWFAASLVIYALRDGKA